VEKFKKFLKTKDAKGKLETKSMGRGNLSIEKTMVSDKPIYMCVFRNTLGNTLFSSKFDGKHSVKRVIPEKASKNQLKVRFICPKPDPETKKYFTEDCVISFTRSDDLKNYEAQFQ
jgi:hypothetical protein